MNKRLALILALTLSLGVAAWASSTGPVMPADEALKVLKDGNARYAAGQSAHAHQGADRRAETAKGGQHPVATIIGCSDSRAPLELIFDQGVGDIFVVRVAGNVAGPDEMATVEYGVGHLGTPVVLVLGHTSCGAVTAVVQNAKAEGNLPLLLNQIKPAVARAKAWNPMASGEDLLNKAIKANVWLAMENLLKKSHEVREFVKQGKIMLVGGIYDLTSGQVSWLGQHPDQGKLLSAAEAGHGMMGGKAVHKPAAKPKPDAKPDAKPEAKSDAKPHGKSDAKHEAKSEGDSGSILPPPEKAAPAAPAGHAPAGKAAHP